MSNKTEVQSFIEDAELEEYKVKISHANPFYDNHIFTEKDIKRATFNALAWIWLWIFPTFVQVNDGYAFHYKNVNGAHYIIKIEKI